MSGQRQTSSPSRPQPVPNSPSGSRGRSPPPESTPRAASMARLTSPIPSVGPHGGSPPVRQISTPTQNNTGTQSPLAGADSFQSAAGPGQSALAAALQGSFGISPPRFGTPPLRPVSPNTAGAALQGSGPQTTYGSFDSRSGQAAARRVPGISSTPVENPRVVKRHLVQPSNLDGQADPDEGPSDISNRPSTVNLKNGRPTATGMGGEDEFSSLQLQGGDMTREVYRWAEDAEAQTLSGGRARRSKSWHISLPDPESEDLDASNIKKPGGFRRDYLRRRAPSPSRQIERSTNSSSQHWSTRGPKTPKILTKSFYEFLSMYGHFAGGDLEEDDEDYMSVAAEYGVHTGGEDDGDWGEASTLLTPGTPGRRKQTLKERGATGNVSPGEAAGLLIKSFVGTGVLFLPKAYLNGGMLFSNVILLFVAMLSYYCFILLVNTSLQVEGSFGDMGGKLYGKPVRYLILGSISLSQAGFVAAYIVFTSQNLQDFVLAVSKCRESIDIKWWILMQALIFLPLSLFRDLGKLGGTAVIADGFILIGLVYLFVYDIRTIAINGHAKVVSFNASEWTSFIGTAIFTFEGVGLIIPIQQSMKDPSRFPPVLAGVMIGITVLFTSIGAVSYAAFGPNTKTVVLSNLPQDNKFVNAVQLLYSIAILLSTPLQLFPAIRIMETGSFSRSGKYNPYIKWKKNVFRFMVVLGCALLAWAGSNNLDKFVSVVGTFACIPLVYVYPVGLASPYVLVTKLTKFKALLHYKAVAMSKRQKGLDILLGVCGLVAMGYTTALTLRGWIAGSENKSPGYCDE